MEVTVIGAGLAGSEATWQIIRRGIPVHLIEMRPAQTTKAHTTDYFAELVCSNSFRGRDLSNAVGLLKEELKLLDSLIMQAAIFSEVPAGGALAVDRNVFSNFITDKLKGHPLVRFSVCEVSEIPICTPNSPLIIATGPLTSRALAKSIEQLCGESSLAFFDAISPIITAESIDRSKIFAQSRYDKGNGADYLNIPLSKEEYDKFIADVTAADKYKGNEAVESDSLDQLRPFEGCMPIEDMIARGPETLRHGPFKPMGLRDPSTGKRPHAVLQLRQDDKDATIWSMVGMQTRMKRDEQHRIFQSLPGLHNAEFVRYGSVHRNTFIQSPKCLDATLAFRKLSGLFFAGQITGVEGYVESTTAGLVAGINAAHLVNSKALIKFPIETAIGSLLHYISDPTREDFQPMNISFGLMPTYLSNRDILSENENRNKRLTKLERRLNTSKIALNTIKKISQDIFSL